MKLFEQCTIAATFGIALLFATASFATNPHIQKIGRDSAEAFCSHHGGGTECSFCDKKHCHAIHCEKGNNCSNAVYPFRTQQTSNGPIPPKNVKALPAATTHKKPALKMPAHTIHHATGNHDLIERQR
jgi:hypothetical protein